MSQPNRKPQHLEKQREDEEDNRLIAGINGEWPSNCENENNGNELGELKLKMAALEVQNSTDRHGRVPLPLELNCQIFECLKFGIQRKYIGGLGREIYAIFRQKVLTKVGLNIWHNFSDYIWKNVKEISEQKTPES
jgi:hypothetical protein